VVQGDRAAVRNTVSGTRRGAFMGYEPTGKHIEMRTMDMRTMDMHQDRDGRIIATWHLEDFAGLLARLSAPADAPARPAWG
jgi:predicted ester cyclase